MGEDPGYAQPYGDYFTDSYEGIWSRDIELFVNMGANTIRLYTFSTSARHTRFMDAAMEAGLTVMAVFEMGTAKETPLTPARNLNYAQQRLLVKVKAAAAHPALTAWLVGNELNGDWNEFVCNPDFEEEIIGHNCTFRDDGRAFLTAIDELCRVVRGEGYLCSTPLAGTGLPKQYGLQTRRSKKYDGAEGVFTMDSVIGWFELGAGVYSDPTSDFPRPEDANFSTPNIDFWSYNSYPGKNLVEAQVPGRLVRRHGAVVGRRLPGGARGCQRDVRPPVVLVRLARSTGGLCATGRGTRCVPTARATASARGTVRSAATTFRSSSYTTRRRPNRC